MMPEFIGSVLGTLIGLAFGLGWYAVIGGVTAFGINWLIRRIL